MSHKDTPSSMTVRVIVLAVVVALTATIGAAVSAQMGSRRPMTEPPEMTGDRGEPGGPGGPGGRMDGPHGGPMGPMGLMGPEWRELHLTADQRTKLRDIMDTHATALDTIRTRMEDAQDALRASVEADTIVEAAIRERASAVGTIQADAAVLHAQIRRELITVLTAEQQALLKERRQEMHERMDRRPFDRIRGPRKPIRHELGGQTSATRGRLQAV